MPLFLATRQNPLDNVKTTFSSWQGCMAKVYCKWPVIVGIIVGSLILLSVIACIARCICCAGEAACCCFRCCTCCCGGSGRGRKSGHRRMDSDSKPGAYPSPHPPPYAASPAPPLDARPVNQQYRASPMPTFNPAPTPDRPQFATFDGPRKPVNPDALPPMPTWSEAREVRVEVEEEEEPVPISQKRGDMEMERLNHNGSSAVNGSMNGMAAVGGAPRPRRSPGPGRQAPSPAADRYGYPNDEFNNSYNNRPYAQQDEYQRGSPGPGPGPSPVYGGGRGGGRGGPREYDRQSPGPGPGPGRSPVYGGAGEYGRQSPAPGPGRSPVHGVAGGYGRSSPAPNPRTLYPDHRNDQQDTYSDPYHNQPPTQRFARSPSPPYHTSPHDDQPYNSPHNQSYHSLPSPIHNPPRNPYDASYAHAPEHLPTIPSYAPPAHEPARSAEPASPVFAYPGQRTYNTGSGAAAGGYSGQQMYQAFQPGGR